MAGLDKIIERIKKNSEINCDSILNDAEKQADELRAASEAKSKADVERIAAETDRKSKEIIDSAHSGSELEEKKEILSAKVEIIDSVIDQVSQTLKDLPDEKYFDAIYKLAGKYARPEDGVMLLSKKDLDRLPADFEKTLNSKLEQGSIKVSKDPRDLDGGFVLSYGGIEINCSFAALIKESEDDIKDELSRILFA